MHRRRLLQTLGWAGLGGPPAWAQAPTGVPATASPNPATLPTYVRQGGLTGAVVASGSSTVAGLLKPLADRFQGLQPEVSFDIGGAGSSTALAGLLASPQALGLLSRPMTSREKEQLRAKYGAPPIEWKVAIDALAIFVFRDNPVPALTLADLRRAFGRDAPQAQRWGALGASGEWAEVPLVRFGLEAGRGAHELMRELVLGGGEFAADLSVEPVSTSVVQGVATYPGGIGYASVFFRTQRTRVMPIEHRGERVEPTSENASSGRYPLARDLYICAHHTAAQPLPPTTQQFLRFVLSADGQAAVARQGMFPISAEAARHGRALLEPSDRPTP